MSVGTLGLSGAIVMLCSSVIHAQITEMTLKGENHKEIVKSATTTDLFASTLFRCATACSLREDCCALSYSYHSCRLDSSCQYTTQVNVNSKVLYSQTKMDVVMTTDITTTSAVSTLPTSSEAITTVGSTLPTTRDLMTIHQQTTPVLTTQQTLTTPSFCNGAVFFGLSCYIFIMEVQAKYSDAKADCEVRGGKLLEIETAEENTFLMNQIKTKLFSRVWLGGHKTGSSWRWDSRPGDDITFFDWRPTEPDNDLCLAVHEEFRWAAVSCSASGDTYYTACELEY